MVITWPLLLFFSLALNCTHFASSQLVEEDRQKEYAARNYKWPPEIIPDTPGWSKLMMRRFRQMEFQDDSNDRYNGYMNVVSSAYVAPNFTENGWGLTRAPQELVDEFRQALKDGLAKEPRLEGKTEVIEEGSTDSSPLMVATGSLNGKALSVLKPYHEAWAGIPLVGSNAYGLRVYRNDSHLNMHVDRSHTHIISCILHIDHDPESEPWPIVIEDFQGNTNEVVLESGDMLFYESSKCLHGRPQRFRGIWYSSLFVHYYPAMDWDIGSKELEVHYGVPARWDHDPPEEEMGVEPLQMVGTSMKEPTCKNNWCALENSVKWYGPSKHGEVLTTGGVIFSLPIASVDNPNDHGEAEL